MSPVRKKSPCLWKMPAFIYGWVLCMLFLFITTTSLAQEYSYVNYDVKDGLAGSTVYDVCQDKFGFLWFATEAGVSRFDGVRFKNYTTADGLPETEIIKLFADSKGRVWMSPFKHAICYYYEGKIYNQQNDSLLKPVLLSSVILDFGESAQGNVIFATASEVYTVHESAGEKREITYSLIDYANKPTYASPVNLQSPFLENDTVFITNNGKDKQFLFTFNDRKEKNGKKSFGPPQQFTSLYSPPGSRKVLMVNSYNGAWMMDTLNRGTYKEVFLEGKPVSHFFIDNENNFWFTTLGSGIYKLVSQEVQTFSFNNNNTSEIFSLQKFDDKLIAGSAFSRAYVIAGSKISELDLSKEFINLQNKFTSNRLLSIARLNKETLVFGFDRFLVRYNMKTGKKLMNDINSVKSVDVVDSNTLLVGLSSYNHLVDSRTLSIKEKIWMNRATAVSYYNNEYFIGTLNGLYVVSKNKTIRFLGDKHDALRNRIGYFVKSPDGSLWVATYGGGVVHIKNDVVIGNITTEHGLTSNVCRSLYLFNSILWVGTDKGLNRVDVSNKSFTTRRYTIADGLPSHIINAIYVDSSHVYVGSPAGLTLFDERKVSNYSNCSLKILEVSVANKIQPIQPAYMLTHKNNSLRISYAGISFRSAGDILYRYRLKGLTSDWDTTRQNLLEYPSLPPGDYWLELQAINKFGVASNMVTVPFSIAAAYWQTVWFQLAVIAAAVVITWLLVAWRFRYMRRREREKTAIQQRMNDLEQLALRAQMNPHFIFNCLNSIQNFVINNNVEATNWYLTEFAHLIRQTLDNSDREAISISNEIKYLQRYLELEKMRFGNAFTFTIESDPGIDRDFTYIPTMILQPYVENSIRHGIRHKRNGTGHIQVRFKQNGTELLCIVEDDGIGRKKSNEYKSHIHVEYQSKGMTLTAERINILNRRQSNPITIEVIDLMDEHNEAAGTKVAIHFPGSIALKTQLT